MPLKKICFILTILVIFYSFVLPRGDERLNKIVYEKFDINKTIKNNEFVVGKFKIKKISYYEVWKDEKMLSHAGFLYDDRSDSLSSIFVFKDIKQIIESLKDYTGDDDTSLPIEILKRKINIKEK